MEKGLVKMFSVCFMLFLLCPIPAMPQGNYPTSSIKLLTGRPAGGNTDLGLRLLAELASGTLGQPVVVETKVGGATYLAFVTAMNSKPDGYTLGDLSTMTFDLSVMYDKVPRKVEDISVIGCYWSIVHGIAARSDAPWNTFKELVDYAKAHPGEITYGVPSVGSPPHLGMVMLAKKEKIPWKMVPYTGIATEVPALLGGHISLVTGLSGVYLEQVKAGKMKLLVITGGHRFPQFPNIPTLKDLGYDMEVSFDIGLSAPKGVPPQILQKLEDAFAKAAKEPKFQNFIKDNEMHYTYINGKEYSQYLKRNYEIRAPIIKELGLAYKQ